MIHFDSSKLAEAFSNGGIYVHSDPYLGYRFVDGRITEGVFTIDYLAPVEFRKDGATNTISFESVIDPEFAGMARVVPEGTDSFRDYRTYGSFRYTGNASAELLNMSYGEKYYTYTTQSSDDQPFVGQLAKLGNCAVAKNGFSILVGPANGMVAFGDNTVVFQVPVQNEQVLDVVLYPPQHMSAPKSDAQQPIIAGNKMGAQSTEDDVERTSGSEREAKTSAEGAVAPSPVEIPAPKDVPQEHVLVPERQLQTPESGFDAGAPEGGSIQKPVPSEQREAPNGNVVNSGSESAKDKPQDNNQMPEELHDTDKPGYFGIIGWLKSIFS